MKSLKRLFRKFGEADVHVWGYSTINTLPNEEKQFQFSGISNLKGLKIMAKKMSSLIRKILSEVGRNEMLSWGYRIEK